MAKRSCLYQIQVGNNIQCAHGTCEHFEETVTKTVCEGCEKRLDPTDTIPVEHEPLEEIVNHVPETLLGKAAQAAKVIAGPVVRGKNPLAAPEIAKARREICDNCPKRRSRTCTLCSCNIYGKVVFELSRCPLGKWPGEQNDETKN